MDNYSTPTCKSCGADDNTFRERIHDIWFCHSCASTVRNMPTIERFAFLRSLVAKPDAPAQRPEAAMSNDLQRFIITRIDGGTMPTPVFLVEDDLTGRVREATFDLEDANAVASWLNAGHTYTGGVPVLQPA
jgi:hypothetical protein